MNNDHDFLDCFTVPTVSQSQTSARILISAAEGILAFNVTLAYGWRRYGECTLQAIGRLVMTKATKARLMY